MKHLYKQHGLVNHSKFFRHIRKAENLPIAKKIVYEDKIRKYVEYINVPSAFDIETSSFKFNMVKMGCMYIWQFGLDGYVVVGRTWEEFDTFIRELAKALKLSDTRRLAVYVHNLAFEFQWIKDRFKWTHIFAREKNVPFRAVCDLGIEFRCSYILSGCKLETTCNNLLKYKCKKKVGDLDYDLVRSPKTPITCKEMKYCVFDIIGVMNYIQEQIEEYKNITNIPMTNTGRVRRYCREQCFSEKNVKLYKFIMKDLKINNREEYEMLVRAFTAGYTHANWQHSEEVFTGVKSKDFTSSYPSVMVCEKHPMSRGQWVEAKSIEALKSLFKSYYVIFNVELHNLKEKENIPDHYISYSKCYACLKAKTDNGRLISAERIQITVTCDDWEIIEKCYTFDKPIIGRAIRYRLGYLPTAFVQCVLDFYKGKTSLKDVLGFEKEYQLKKGMLNSCFGMAVTSLISDIIGYETEWTKEKPDVEDAIAKYNKDRNRFLFYPWGISICSKARKNLWSGILELGEDYIYSDTDSVKYINAEKHNEYFEQYNKNVEEKMREACRINHLNFEDTCPKTVKGKIKPLGVWDDDGEYAKFKTLGAKRYLTEDYEGHIKATIAGANKFKSAEYISQQEDPFEFFSDHMKIDEEHSGRLIHTYFNTPVEFEITDYLGNSYKGEEKSGINLSKAEYNLKLTPLYVMLLQGKVRKSF